MRSSDVTGLHAITDRQTGTGRKSSWKVIAGVIWLITTLALAGWWLVFGLQQLALMGTVAVGTAPNIAHEIERRHLMLMSEGLTLFFLLLAGGSALIYYISSEIRRSLRIQEFFAAFTHDLKTSLASLRLQAESLEEDLKDSGQAKVMRRLVKDTVRLELQLENSLLLASPDDSRRLLLEPIRVRELISPMQYQWPELQIVINGDATLMGDTRSLESIIKNLLQNSFIHGRADRVEISITPFDEGVRIQVADNGEGFGGDHQRLGKMFHRHSSTSGSGLGLYLATRLSQQMNGELRVVQTQPGFIVELEFPVAGRAEAAQGVAR